MKLEVQFAGYAPVTVDTEYASCAIFEKLTATQAAEALEFATMGDADENGWIAANIGGEDCQVRVITPEGA